MTGLERIRRRLPLVVFVLLLVLVVLMVGFACACFGDRSLNVVERTLGAAAAGPALVEMWAALVAIVLIWSAPCARAVAPTGRGSPALLQCFLR